MQIALRSRRCRVLIPLAFALVAVTFAGERPTAVSSPLWRKPVMIGASAAAGFTVDEPLGGTNTQALRLSRHVDAAIRAPHAPVLNLASALFFLQPESSGRAQVARALAEQPSVVFAADFPFWFLYGRGTNDAERLLRFEQGLRLLGPFTCPVVLGDLPDASAAVNRILRPDQMPSLTALNAANQRLNTWVAERTNFTVISLARLIQVAQRDRSFTLRDEHFPAGRTRALVQADQLHPSATGSAVIALTMLDALQRGGHFPARDVRWNSTEIVKEVRDRIANAARPVDPPIARPNEGNAR